LVGWGCIFTDYTDCTDRGPARQAADLPPRLRIVVLIFSCRKKIRSAARALQPRSCIRDGARSPLAPTKGVRLLINDQKATVSKVPMLYSFNHILLTDICCWANIGLLIGGLTGMFPPPAERHNLEVS
jgi:hypothetical protein